MAAQNYKQIQSWVGVYEGGYVNHPRDPGGATNRGITQVTYNGFRRRHGRARQSVRRLTDAEHDFIYRTQYWNRVRGDDLPSGVDLGVYDWGVKSGPARSIKALQRAVSAKADGVMGPKTLGLVKHYCSGRGAASLVTAICARRMKFLRRLDIWPDFGDGWTRRVEGRQPGAQPGDDVGVLDRGVGLAYGRADRLPMPKTAAPDRPLKFRLRDNLLAKSPIMSRAACSPCAAAITSSLLITNR